jgi:hypothetical protein
MSVVIVLIFVAMIMGIGMRRNRKTKIISEMPLSKIDEKNWF